MANLPDNPINDNVESLLQSIETISHDDLSFSSPKIKRLISAKLAALYRTSPEKFSQWHCSVLEKLERKLGVQQTLNIVLRLEVMLGWRKPTLAIYDHTFHMIGGGQKYGLMMADILQQQFDITLIANKPLTHQQIFDWYQFDLSHCAIKIIPIPYYEEGSSVHLDPARVKPGMPNPFHVISKESGNYDWFINNSMLEMVYPLANYSLLVCHFPERRPKTFFYANYYQDIIFNSLYTKKWIEAKWKITPRVHIYPPNDLEPAGQAAAKEPVILSVARFEQGGSKKQLDMVRTFLKLNEMEPECLKKWSLLLVGGSTPNNPYLEKVKQCAANHPRIRIKPNASLSELKECYSQAALFWHWCGLNQTDPALVEHFGMTIVEAMQNKVVPVVFDGGGQQEIVDHGVNGFRITSLSEGMRCSLQLIENSALLQTMAKNALQKSRVYNREAFAGKVQSLFAKIHSDYLRADE